MVICKGLWSIKKRNYIMKWTVEKLQEEANKYQTRGEFWKKSPNIASHAQKRKIMDNLFENHENKGYCKDKTRKWSKEKLQEECNKYKTRKEFLENDINCYSAILKKGLMNELFKNHENKGYSEKQKVAGYWTIEKTQEECNKYKTIGDFQKGNGSAYNSALKQNYLPKLFENHSNNGYSEKQKILGYWTIEKLQEECNKYETRKELRENNYAAYVTSKRKKLLNKLFENHINEGYIDKDEWTENCYTIYVYELINFNKSYVGLTNNIYRRDKEHLFGDELLINFCKNNNMALPKYIILEENLKSTDAQKREKYWLEYYKANNWEMFNISKTGSLGSASKIWNKKKLQMEVNKYNNRKDFKNYCKKGYYAASRRKILDELFKNHLNKGYTKIKKPD